ncbi:MAG: hypothetical protein K0R15_195 [Clostridiales bacterium]|jgi:hypothetical protein|nr:hypothetical protein [Clostridiales bacterium]
MLVQIEYYDDDSLTNLVSILSMKPDKVIFIYDKEVTERKSIELIFKTCKMHLNDLRHEMYAVDSESLGEVCDLMKRIIPQNDECVVDLTGGIGLMAIGGYKIAKERGLKMIYADIRNNRLIDVDKECIICPTENITLVDYLSAKGAYLIGNSHIEPNRDDFDYLNKMCKFIFKDLSAWSETCRYMQLTMAGEKGFEVFNKESIKFNQQTITPDRKLLEYCETLRLIKHLRIGEDISFKFTSALAKQYLTNYGVWLEIFVYIEALKLDGVTDVRLGAMIDWDANDGVEQVGSEIDVVLCKDSSPIFISCKLREPDIAAINEIVINTKRIGGNKGKGILVTFSNIKSSKIATYQRAKEMGIRVLDKSDILSKDFGVRLSKTIDSLKN